MQKFIYVGLLLKNGEADRASLLNCTEPQLKINQKSEN